MRLLRATAVSVCLLALAPSPATAATRGECEAGLKRLQDAEPSVKPQFLRKFNQQRRRALEAQKKEDWNACAATAAEALVPGRPERPADRK